jgi:hypothetical protein
MAIIMMMIIIIIVTIIIVIGVNTSRKIRQRDM